jgi:hypothetical protein
MTRAVEEAGDVDLIGFDLANAERSTSNAERRSQHPS